MPVCGLVVLDAGAAIAAQPNAKVGIWNERAEHSAKKGGTAINPVPFGRVFYYQYDEEQV